MATAREMEREISLLKERLDSTQRAWSSTKRELEERDMRFTSIDRELKEHSLNARNSEVAFRNFKETLANLLSDEFHRLEPYEEPIRERIQAMCLAVRDKSAVSQCRDPGKRIPMEGYKLYGLQYEGPLFLCLGLRTKPAFKHLTGNLWKMLIGH